MAKCRLLYQENEELGKVISSGRIAKLEGELALQKSFSDEVKKSQSGKLTTIGIHSLSNKFLL
jgi:pre-mRNA-splicing regulator WTAP